MYELLHCSNGTRYAMKEMDIKNGHQMSMAVSEAEMLKVQNLLCLGMLAVFVCVCFICTVAATFAIVLAKIVGVAMH